MRRLRPSSEAEMVALFLRTELPVARSRDDLRALLERARLSERVAVGGGPVPADDGPAGLTSARVSFVSRPGLPNSRIPLPTRTE